MGVMILTACHGERSEFVFGDIEASVVMSRDP